VERLNLKRPNDLGVKEQYQLKISNRSVALETLYENTDNKRA